jgi:hypothetical protein
MMGMREIAGIPLNAGTIGMVVNLAVGLGHPRGNHREESGARLSF